MATVVEYCPNCGRTFEAVFGAGCPHCAAQPPAALGEQTAQPAPEVAATATQSGAPWGAGTGLLTWFASVALIFGAQFIALIVYIFWQVAKTGSVPKTLKLDWLLAILSIVLTFPAHLLTLAFCWLIVTKGGQRPFWQTLGWRWHPQFKWVHATALAFLMMGVALVFSKFLPHRETDLEMMLKLGASVRILVALLAVLTAPLVEEIVYRGVLFLGLRRGTIRQACIVFGAVLGLVAAAWYLHPLSLEGKKLLLSGLIGTGVGVIVWYVSELITLRAGARVLGEQKTIQLLSVVDVSLLFALVHVPQYWGSWAAISTILLLSVVLTVLRAATGSILPGVATHLVYNGVQAVVLVLSQDEALKKQTTETALALWTQLFGCG